MVNFDEKSSENTIIFANFSPKLAKVRGLKILDFNRTPSFYLRGYGSKNLWYQNAYLKNYSLALVCPNEWGNPKSFGKFEK